MAHQRFRICLVSIVFLFIIFSLFINNELRLINDIPSSENRKMEEKPVFDINSLDDFPLSFEKYYSDKFSIRSIMVKYYNLFNIEWFNKSPLPDKVVIGNDNWLFMAGDEFDSYRGKYRFEPSELEAFKAELEYRKAYLNKRGCQFYFMIAPSKASIYSDKIPGSVFRLHHQSWGEQLLEYLTKNSTVKPIDVFTVLRAYKDQELLYYKLDNHWNQSGAFYATNELLRRIQLDYPQVNLQSKKDFEIRKLVCQDGNIVSMLSNVGDYNDTLYWYNRKPNFKAVTVKPVGYPAPKTFPYGYDYETNKEIKGSNRPRALMISDSFGSFVFPFFSEEFSRSVKIFDNWEFKLNEEILAQENPQVFVLIVLESHLKKLLKHQSRLTNVKNNN